MGVYDGLKDVAKVLQESGKIEQYRQILDAQQQMLEMQKKIGELEAENKNLKEKLETKGKLRHDRNAYWLEEDGKNEGPFCTRCWDVEKHLVRMHPCGNRDFSECPNCKSGSVRIHPESPHERQQPYQRTEYE